jgi:stress responsive alpha/beta barrel protein
MITHMVLLKIKPSVPAQKVERVLADIGALRKVIPGIRSYSAGAYTSPEGMNKGYTHGFCMVFDDAARRDAYLPHPAHEVVKKKVLELLEGGLDGVVAFDFES